MTKKEKDELITLREEIEKLRDEVRQSRTVFVPRPYPVYPQPYYPPVQPWYPWQPYRITWGGIPGAIPMTSGTIQITGNAAAANQAWTNAPTNVTLTALAAE